MIRIKRLLYGQIKEHVDEAIGEKELLFSERREQVDKLLNLTEGIGMELMKAIEFYELGGKGKMIDHWISVASGKLIEIHKAKGTVKFHMGLIGALYRKDIISMLSFGDYDKVVKIYPSPIKYIKDVKTKLSSQTNSGEEKYSDWLIKDNKGFLVSDDDYLIYFKFITLCLAGIMDPDNFMGWEILSTKKNEIMWLDVPQSPKIVLNKQQINSLLRNCIDKIVTNISYPKQKQ